MCIKMEILSSNVILIISFHHHDYNLKYSDQECGCINYIMHNNLSVVDCFSDW